LAPSIPAPPFFGPVDDQPLEQPGAAEEAFADGFWKAANLMRSGARNLVGFAGAVVDGTYEVEQDSLASAGGKALFNFTPTAIGVPYAKVVMSSAHLGGRKQATWEKAAYANAQASLDRENRWREEARAAGNRNRMPSQGGPHAAVPTQRIGSAGRGGWAWNVEGSS